ncbi:MAG: hypothetical protein FWD44_03870 [Oscillospiraceae bacterium]|nr:hypothetical protein [Oscillospiraceae bacterium]
MSKFESSDRGKLQEYLKQELEAFEKIRALTQELAEQINEDKVDALNKTLSKRQEQIEKINGLHQESSLLMQSYASLQQGEKDGEIDDILSQIQEITQSCANLNDESFNILRVKSEEQTEKIDKQSAKRKGISGYAQAVAYAPEVIDKKT